MTTGSTSGQTPGFYSIGRRFSYALIGVVTLILLGFAALVLWVNVARLERQLDARLTSTLKIAETSLAGPLWNFDYETVQSVIEALLLEESTVYVDVVEEAGTETRLIAGGTRPPFAGQDFGFFAASSRFAVTASTLVRQGKQIGTIRLVLSKDAMREELRLNIIGTVLLTLLVIGAIALVSMAIARRYLSRPLQGLQASAQRIAAGDLETEISAHGNDEIGQLAANLGTMRDSIRSLFAELRQQHEQLEQYNHDLEQKVGERTAELARAKDEAETANRAKSAFLANMSHELRTPLNAILGFAQLLDRSAGLETEQRDNLAIIHRSGEHLLTLINDVLEISRIEAGRTHLQEENFDLHRLLGDLEDLFGLRARGKGLTFHCADTSDLPRYVRADQSKLRQILINLLGNAVKFTEEGEVMLRVGYGDDGRLCCAVEDTGVGIAPEELETLFDAFVQTADSRHRPGGSGLGLAISQQFAGLLGGRIEVESQLDQGSVFSFDIPVELVHASQVAAVEPTRRALALAPDQPRYRLLAVDDQQDNRRLLRQLLEPMGFEVREAADGRESVEVWETWQPQLIWMDIRMPVMDGYEATRRIKAEATDTVVVALTASAFEEQRQQVLAAGCDDFVRKPFREEEIVAALERHLGVRFAYAEEEPVVEEVEYEAEQLVDMLAQLPADWRAELRRTAGQADEETCLELLEKIREEDPELARVLTRLVRDFSFDELLELLDPQTEEEDV